LPGIVTVPVSTRTLYQLLPLPILTWSTAVQLSVRVQRSSLCTSAVQCTEPSGLQAIVTRLMFRWQTVHAPGTGVVVTVAVFVEVLVAVFAGVLVLVAVLVAVSVGILVGVLVGGGRMLIE